MFAAVSIRWFVLPSMLVVALVTGTSSWAVERKEIGVVVMHGKWDSPSGYASGLASYLEREGFIVINPEMPWSGRREYDKGAKELLVEIDNALNELKAQGVKKVALLGHSQGGVAALYYASQKHIEGIALVAPGGYPQGKKFVEHFNDTIDRARELMAEDKGEEKIKMVDLNSGDRTRGMKVPVQSFIDYFDPFGAMNSFMNASNIKSGVSVLWVAPEREADGLHRMSSETFGKLPNETVKSKVLVPADHLDAPDAAKPHVRDWLLKL